MSSPLFIRARTALIAVIALVAALTLIAQGASAPSASAATTLTVSHSDVTTVRGTVNKTYYTGTWGSTSRSHYGTDGAAFEIAFAGTKLELWGLSDTGHGTGRVFVDDTEVGIANYRSATKNSTPHLIFSKDGLGGGNHTLRVQVEGGYIDHCSVVFTPDAVPAPTADDLTNAIRAAAIKKQADYSPASWAPFSQARSAAAALGTGGSTDQRAAALAALKTATTGLVEIRGLQSMVDGYDTRVPTDFTAESWQRFAAALNAAHAAAESEDASTADVVAAKTSLQDAAAALVTVSQGSFEPITNNTFWNDTDGNPIYSQGGGVFRFGDTYYWYGVHYQGAEAYRANPSKTYSSTFESIPVYSSKDLVHWKFENNVATRDTPITIPESQGHYFAQMQTLADAIWVGRLGVVYNANTGKYVLMVQSGQGFDPDTSKRGMVLFLQGDSPTDDFDYANIQPQIGNVSTNSTGDQTVFTDDDGTSYLIFSNSGGRANAYVSRIAPADSLSIEPAVRVGRSTSGGREGNAMFKLGGTYYMLTSDLHGWDSSVNHVIQSLTADIQGAYSPEYTLAGTEQDYSLVTQTGFFVTVHGTKQDTVLYAGDRWADFAWNGIGYNQWVPLSADDSGLSFNALTNWEFNAVTGEWRVGAANNYVRNPDFAADRVAVTTPTGWTTTVDTDSATDAFVSNPKPGADSSQFALQLGAAGAFSGSVSQTDPIPDGVYTFAAKVNTAGGLEYARAVIRGSEGQKYTVDLNVSTDGWQSVQLSDLKLTGGQASVSIEARSPGGNQSVKVDSLSLTRQTIDRSSLQQSYATAKALKAADYSSRSWRPITKAGAVLDSVVSTQAEVDAANAALSAADGGLEPAVNAVTATTSRPLYAVGSAFDAASLTVTATRSDGSIVHLTGDQYALSGFAADKPATKTIAVTVDPDLTATDASAVAATFVLTVLTPWNAATVFNSGDRVLYQNSLWQASWWTQNQKPGDPNGPWQEIRDQDGIAIWTATRIFNTGDTVLYNGATYTAKWWTRNQAPGDANGPWKKVG